MTIRLNESVQVCSTDKVVAATSDNKQFKRCSCVWLAGIFIYGHGTCPDSDSSISVSLRSASPAGTVLSISISFNYSDDPGGGDPCVGHSGTVTFNVTVGTDTSGAWTNIGTFTVGSASVNVLMNAYNPDPDSPAATIREYAPRLPDLGSQLTGEFASYPNTPYSPINFAGAASSAGVTLPTPFFNIYAIDDPPLSITNLLLAMGGAPYYPLNVIHPNAFANKRACFQLPVFGTLPSTVSTDDLFDVELTFVNVFTNVAADGTHTTISSSSDKDIDTVPILGLAYYLDVAEGIAHPSSPTRLGFAHYKFSNCQMFCRAGLRQIEAAPSFEFGTFALVSQVRKQSAEILVLPGAPSCIDVLPAPGETVPTFPTPVISGSILNVAGSPLKARVLDNVGCFGTFNVVPTATNTILVAMTQFGTNYFTSPTLLGTTSRSAVKGIADFDDLRIKGLGRNYRLTWSSSGLSGSFNDYGHVMEFSVATNLKIEAPTSIAAGSTVSIKVTMIDGNGATLIPSTADNITLSGSGSFTGFNTLTPVSGVATFTGIFPVAGTYTIQATVSGSHYDGPGSNMAPVLLQVVVS